MTTEIYVEGLLEPIETNDPMHATALNMSAAMNNNLLFFMVEDVEGHSNAVSVARVIHIKDNS